jgi:hypothetical protein
VPASCERRPTPSSSSDRDERTNEKTENNLDLDAVGAFAEKVGVNHAATVGAALAYVGDRLGLWEALATSGAVTSTELAGRTGLAERYLREWLAAQAARC